MKKITIGLTTLIILASTSFAEVTKGSKHENKNKNTADIIGYWGLHIGAGKFRESGVSTTEAGFQIGTLKDFTSFVAGLEFDATFSGDTNAQRFDTYVGNVLVGYSIDKIMMPYALAGIGGAYIKDQFVYDSTFKPTYQGGAGVRFFGYGTSYVDLAWRYVFTPSIELGGWDKFDLKSNHLFVSIGTTF